MLFDFFSVAVTAAEFRAEDVRLFQVFGLGFRFRVSGFRFRIPGLGLRS